MSWTSHDTALEILRRALGPKAHFKAGLRQPTCHQLLGKLLGLLAILDS